MDRYLRGILGEELASQHFTNQGFSPLFRRYKTPHGELDLIMRKDSLILFIEVKSRKKFYKNSLNEIITARQITRNYNAAEFFLGQHPEYNDFSCRFDLVIIKQGVIIKHIKNIYT